jgi:hypothetical protein
MNAERSRILVELRDSARAREDARMALTAAQERLGPIRARLRACREWKALIGAKGSAKVAARELAASIERHDAIEAELFSGRTGLELFDAPRSNGKPEPAAAGVGG